MSITPPVVTETPEPSAAATPVADKRTRAKGAIPKQVQSWIFLGIVGIVAVGLWFSGIGKTPKKTNASSAAAADQPKPVVGGLSPDEVLKSTQESEQARHSDARNARNPRPTPSAPLSDAYLIPNTGLGPGNQPTPRTSMAPTPGADPIKDDERKREYMGRYSSNVAFSYRTDQPATSPVLQAQPNALGRAGTPEDLASGASRLPGVPADVQRQLETLQAQHAKPPAPQQSNAAAQPAGLQAQQAPVGPAPARRDAVLNAATGKNHVIFEGTVLESVLVNRLNGDFAGPVICQTTNDVYSHDHSQLLIPAGSRLLGETKKVSDVGQDRLAVVFHRLIMPDGYSVDLDQAPGLNQIGETALHDKVNNHYFKIFGSSIAVGAIAGLASIGTGNSAVTGLPTSNASAYREGVTGSLSQSSLRILDRFLNIPPTITIREGHRVRIFLTQDLLVPAYAQHRMPSDL
jgi:type IV secretion system protein VirB10